MAGNVGIVTDSVACLPPDRIASLNIGVVPVHLLVGSEDHLDGTLPERDLHGRLAGGEKATTATPSPGEFLATYETMAAGGASSLVVCTVSGALSNLANAARIGARGSPVPVEVIDTRTVASAQGLIVRRLAEEARRGRSLRELVDLFPAVRAATGLVAMVPDLTHLARTGRVPRVAAAIGGQLSLKPLIRIGDDGEAHSSGLVRSIESGVGRMIRRATAAVAGGGRLVVMHTLAAELAQEMATRLDDAAAVDDIEIAPFTTVMGIHTGPGLVGIAWDATPGNDREGAAG